KNVFLRAREQCKRSSTCLSAQTHFPRNHEKAGCDGRKPPRVEPRRYAEHKSTNPLGGPGHKISNVTRDLCGEASRIELKVLHQRGETLNDVHWSLAPRVRSHALIPAQLGVRHSSHRSTLWLLDIRDDHVDDHVALPG